MTVADRKPRPAVGVAALLLCAALWSLNGPLIKMLHDPAAMHQVFARLGIEPLSAENADQVSVPPGASRPAAGVSPWVIASYRSLIGGLFFLPLAWPHRRTLAKVTLRWRIASVLTFTAMTTTFVVATTMTTASNAIVLQYTSPLVVFLLSPWLLGERPAGREAAVMLIVLLGVAIIFLLGDHGDLPGLTISLSSGLWYGALTVVLRGLRTVDARVVVAMNTLFSGVALLIVVAALGTFSVSGYQLAILAILGVAQFATPYLLFSYGVQHVEAHRASLITLLEVLLNPLLTWLAIGEKPPFGTLIGGPVILAGVVAWILLAARRRVRA